MEDERSWRSVKDIHQRIGHITVAYKHYIVVFGGFVVKGEVNIFIPSHLMWFYNTLTEIWTLVKTEGESPQRYSGCTGVVCGDSLYVIGGMMEDERGVLYYSNTLYEFDFKRLFWRKVRPNGKPPAPCDKGVGWAYEGKVYFFGGYGVLPTEKWSYDVHFNIDTEDLNDLPKGWNNQLYCYDPDTNELNPAPFSGEAPSSRAACAADICGHKAFICGGRQGRERTNDIYYLNMKTMTWSKNLNEGKTPDEIPDGVSWHTFNFIGKNKAALYGGLRKYGSPSFEYWICNITDNDEITWERSPENIQPLIWHKAAFSTVTSELFIIGGVFNSPYEMCGDDHVYYPVVLNYEPKSLFRLCLYELVEDTTLIMDEDIQIPTPIKDLILTRINQKDTSTELTIISRVFKFTS